MDWGAIQTALLLGVLAYLWRQSGKVDSSYQALFGVQGKGGLHERVEVLEEQAASVDRRIEQSRHTIRNELAPKLATIEERFDRRIENLERPR